MNLKALFRRTLWKYWYPYLTGLTRDSAVIFLNYGYVDLNPQAQSIPLSAEDESNRLYIQLYHHIAGVKGSRIFESFKSGDSVYVCYTLRKPADSPKVVGNGSDHL